MSNNLEILGLPSVNVRAITEYIEDIDQGFVNWESSKFDKSPLDLREQYLEECFCVCVFRHLGFYENNAEFIQRAIELGNRLATEYFYGQHIHQEPWRSTMRKEGSNEDLSWLVVFREGLLLSTLCDNKETQVSLANWLEKDVPFDESSYLLKEADNAYYKLLASYLRGDGLDTGLVEQIQSTWIKRPRLLLDCVAALEMANEKQLQSAMKKYLSHYIKSELCKSGFPTLFCIDASIIYNLAVKSNLNIAGLNEKQHSIIMTRNSLGI